MMRPRGVWRLLGRTIGGDGLPTPPTSAINDAQQAHQDRLVRGDLQWLADSAVGRCRLTYLASRHASTRQELSQDPNHVDCLQPPSQDCILISKHGQFEEYDHIVMVAFRGSEMGNDWQTNFQCDSVPCELPGLGGKVHKGWLATSASLHEDVNMKIQECLHGLPGRKMVLFTGHSSGGALAVLEAARFHPSKPADVDISVFTLGCPRIGDDEFAQSFLRLVPQTFQLVTAGDVVPFAPPSRTWKHLCRPLALDSTGSEMEQHKLRSYAAAWKQRHMSTTPEASVTCRQPEDLAASRDRSRSPRLVRQH